MADLWAQSRAARQRAVEPLAQRMRPRTLDEFVGQTHILGEGKLLRRMLRADAITSLILYGPPGTGKTTLAEVIAGVTRRRFVAENAASVGVKRIREIIDEAAVELERSGRRTILFLDEVHRFTRAQQDVLLADVESGLLTFIGATTENPTFAVNSALVSRSTLFRLEPLSREEVTTLLRRAIADRERGYGGLDLRVSEEALRVWADKCEGDARRALTALEVAVLSGGKGGGGPPIVIDREVAQDSIQQKAAVYDATGDQHYDTISAFIKSVRGGDPDAAIYWLAVMLEAGEDPRFIARRLAILASEDVGNADPRGILVAQSAWDLTERVGMPECRIILAQATTYLALAPKSNASYLAIESAIGDVREGRTVPVPMFLRDPHSSPNSEGEAGPRPGEGYRYAHDLPGRVGDQDYLGVDRAYYHPTDQGEERSLRQRLEEWRRRRQRCQGKP
jgi:putative ATPase